MNTEAASPQLDIRHPTPDTRHLIAYPLGKGSGSVTTFSRADGFVTIGRHTEIVEAGELVEVHRLGRELAVADLVAIGSHCVGLDYLLSQLQQRGITSKLIAVGSTAGLEAVRRGECDIAGVHLFDPRTGQYNRPFLTDQMVLVEGYGRLQGIVFRRGDARFEGRNIEELIPTLANQSDCVMVNRNQGSGTRVLIDRLLGGTRPSGYAVQPTTHNAVAAAVAQGRADWGLAIQTVARSYNLGFIPYQDERYDFVIPKSRRDRPAVDAFIELIVEPATRAHLHELGFRIHFS